MEFKKYTEAEDYNYDNTYSFIPLGSSEKEYTTAITIDFLNSDMEDRGNVIRISCNCQDYERRRRRCKHISECLRILSTNQKFREDGSLNRYWCNICHQHCDTSTEEPKCYKCDKEMTKSSEVKIANNLNKSEEKHGKGKKFA